MFTVKKAERQQRPLKVSMEGISGSGKTFTSLRMAFDWKRHGIGSRIVVMDSENESASLYAGTDCDGQVWEFDTVSLSPAHKNPMGYTQAYVWAVQQKYDIIIFDSLSHAWHGALEKVDAMGKFNGWKTVSPEQRKMIEVLTNPNANLIATMRVKSDYVHDLDERGKTKITKVGTKADQRENTEYEFDLTLRFSAGNICQVEKVRGCQAMNARNAVKPGPEFWEPLIDWWKGGTKYEAPPIESGPINIELPKEPSHHADTTEADIIRQIEAATTAEDIKAIKLTDEQKTPRVMDAAKSRLAIITKK